MEELIPKTNESARKRQIESDTDLLQDRDENVCRNPNCKIARKHCHINDPHPSGDSP